MLRDTRRNIGETAAPVLTFLFCGTVIFIVVVLVSVGVWRFYAPANVAIENQTFHQSQAYNDGMAQELDELRTQYNNATTDDERYTIEASIRQQFAGYDDTKLPPYLRDFLQAVGGLAHNAATLYSEPRVITSPFPLHSVDDYTIIPKTAPYLPHMP